MRNRKPGTKKRKYLPAITKERTKQPETQQEHQEQEQQNAKMGKGFYACYLLTSLCPRFKGHTYIGFTVNPRRRIRQHNGEIRSGAHRTKKRRPWEMVFCIYGFPTNVSALQFEWAWQHPMESVAVRQAAATFKTFSGLANKIKLAYTMLNLPAWQSLNITVNYFSTKYTKHSAGCPSLSEHMKVQVCPMDELPCYTEAGEILFDGVDAEDGWDDEEYEKDTKKSGIVEHNSVGLQPWFLDEFPRCHGREESSFDSGEENNDEGCKEVSNASRTMNGNAIFENSADAHCVIKSSYEQRGWFEEHGKKEQRDPLVPQVVHNSAGAPSVSKNYSEEFGWFEECGRRGQMNPPMPSVQPSHFNSFVRTAFPIAAGFSTGETRDRDLSTLTNESVSEVDWQRGKKIINKVVADRGQQKILSSTIPPETEIIDLLSPSPECRMRSSGKKRRVSPVSPLIIDLT